jgi:hypothetical protein
MLDAERVVFLVVVGLSFEGLAPGGMTSGVSGLDRAGFPPRPARVRAGASSCRELRRCEVRVGGLRGGGIKSM